MNTKKQPKGLHFDDEAAFFNNDDDLLADLPSRVSRLHFAPQNGHYDEQNYLTI
jgi:hypothetical protein